jgi:tetratricopeptide (TPR) repeat protein
MSGDCHNSFNDKHLTVAEIAGLIEGRHDDAEGARLWEHLLGCERCIEIYRESVIDWGIAQADRSALSEFPELVEAGLQIAVCKKAGTSGRVKRAILSSLSALAAVHRYIASIAAILAVVAAGIWLLNIEGADGPSIPRTVMDPVRYAAGTISRRGPIIMHGGEYAITEKSTAKRSGFVQVENSLRSSLDYLYSRYENDSATPEGMYWLAAGYVATGQIDLARDLVAHARKEGMDDLRMLNLEALVAYIEGDLDRAERLFASIHVIYPDDPVSSINLAVVLMELGKFGESASILAEVVERFGDTPCAQRAKALLNTM